MCKTCCIFGHRRVLYTPELEEYICKTAERLISEENVRIFLFGSKSDFNSLCYNIISDLKSKKYPHIKRIYVRAELGNIDNDYKSYLLERYEDSYFPEKAKNAGKAVYIQRNYDMIDKSNFCMVYSNDEYIPPKRKASKRDAVPYPTKSCTMLSCDYAAKRRKIIINCASL